jgi:hypothetical protein
LRHGAELFRNLHPIILCLLFGTSAFARKKPPAQPVKINTANSEQLRTCRELAHGREIFEMRKSYGAFNSVDDLLAIRRLGPKRLEKMRKYLTIGKSTTKSTARKKASLPPKADN